MAASTIETDGLGPGDLRSRTLRGWIALTVMGLFGALPLLIFPDVFEAWNVLILMLLCMVFLLFHVLRGDHVGVFVNAVLVFLIIYPFFVQSLVRFSFIGISLGDLHEKGLVTMGLYVLCLNLAYLVTAAPRGEPARSFSVPPAHGGTVLGVALFCFVAIYLLFGPEQIFLSRLRTHFGEAESLSNFQRFLLDILRLLPFWMVFLHVVRTGGRLSNPFVWAALGIGILICNPVNTQRFTSLFALSLVFFALLVCGRATWYWRNAYLLTIFALIVLPVTSSMRSGDIDFGAESIAGSFFSLEFSAITLLNDSFLLGFESDIGPVRLLTGLLILVPRAIWSAKNTGTGIEIAEYAGYSFTNVGVPPVVDAYLDAGYVGVALFGLACGWAFRRAARVLTGQARTVNLWFAAGISLIGLTPMLMRGDFSTFFTGFYSAVFAFGAARLLARFSIVRDASTNRPLLPASTSE